MKNKNKKLIRTETIYGIFILYFLKQSFLKYIKICLIKETHLNLLKHVIIKKQIDIIDGV